MLPGLKPQSVWRSAECPSDAMPTKVCIHARSQSAQANFAIPDWDFSPMCLSSSTTIFAIRNNHRRSFCNTCAENLSYRVIAVLIAQ